MKYGCQDYDKARMCRYDRREIDTRCKGCQRVTDQDYLVSMGLWIDGVSHTKKDGETHCEGHCFQAKCLPTGKQSRLPAHAQGARSGTGKCQ